MKRQHAEVVDINDDQDQQDKKLGPLSFVPIKGLHILQDHPFHPWREWQGLPKSLIQPVLNWYPLIGPFLGPGIGGKIILLSQKKIGGKNKPGTAPKHQ